MGFVLPDRASSMSQTASPWPGSSASRPVCCRFSIRKYFVPDLPPVHSRWHALAFDSMVGSVRVDTCLTTFGLIQPSRARHQQLIRVGLLPPPPHEPPPIRHHSPTPADW